MQVQLSSGNFERAIDHIVAKEMHVRKAQDDQKKTLKSFNDTMQIQIDAVLFFPHSIVLSPVRVSWQAVPPNQSPALTLFNRFIGNVLAIDADSDGDGDADADADAEEDDDGEVSGQRQAEMRHIGLALVGTLAQSRMLK